jgi:glycosyltransferase involved in cell wall biosynthesis
VEKIWPLVKQKIKKVRLKIVGNAPSQKVLNYGISDPEINVLGQIEDIRYAFKSADLLLAPVFSGKGTRYKILEAMACSTPVVASKIAVEGLDVENGKHVLTSNDAQELAELTIKVLTDQKLWKKLSDNGKQFVEDHYDWQMISQKLDTIYQKVGKIKK